MTLKDNNRGINDTSIPAIQYDHREIDFFIFRHSVSDVSQAGFDAKGEDHEFSNDCCLIAAFVGLAAFPVSASAATAHTTTSLNVRSGPGPGYARVATLPAGHRVTLFHCEGSWCAIRTGGISGWASSSYLDRSYVVRPVIVQPHIVIRPPHYRPHRPHRPPHRPERPHKPLLASARSHLASPANRPLGQSSGHLRLCQAPMCNSTRGARM